MKKAVAISVLLALTLGACGPTEVSGPPDIDYGRDICEQCGMSIDDERFAAGFRLPDGTEHVFDDVGGLLAYIKSSPELGDADVWVHDYETEMWVRSEDAYFVPTDEVTSPMGFGILCFSDEGRATSFAANAGDEVLNWDSVLALPTEVRQPGDMNMPDMPDTTDMADMTATDS
jgi:copper chaperone NosL